MASNSREYYTNLPYTKPPTRATAWQVEHRPESGTYVTTPGGVLLFRVSEGLLHFWDKKSKAEVSISVEHIMELANGV